MLHVFPAFTQWSKMRITQCNCGYEGSYSSCRWYLWPIYHSFISFHYPMGWFVVSSISWGHTSCYKRAQRNHCTPTFIALSCILMNAPSHQSRSLLWHNPSLDKLCSQPISPLIWRGAITTLLLPTLSIDTNPPTGPRRRGSSHCCPRYVNHQLFRTKSNSIIVVIPAVPPSTAYLL